MKLRIAVVGVSGYSGLEMMNIALGHPNMECVAAMASDATGSKPLDSIHPKLRGLTSLHSRVQDAAVLADLGTDAAFLCTPNEVSLDLAPRLLEKGIKVVDLSGAFRLREAREYPSWYGFSHDAPGWLEKAVYGLSEWNAEAIRSADLVANPGCYPTSILLALLPLVRAGLLDKGAGIICDSKSGVTGAGRSAKLNLLFGELSENFRPYSPIAHKHAPEICQELGWDISDFTFIPHLLPVNRGILSTIYVSFERAVTQEEVAQVYARRYSEHAFIRILSTEALPELKAVAHTNFCDIAWRLTAGGRRAVIFSAIDNLGKGAAGQAVQNFNLIYKLRETAGLLNGDDVAHHG
jgi:N-acetyl-gamma-glutamyl-phosphate reductase